MINKIKLMLVLVMVTSILNATEYTYSGANFTDVFGSYSTGDHITGSFTTAMPLADNMSRADISALVQTYTFNDGHQTLDNTNSTILQFFIGTNSQGNPNEWGITVWQSPITTVIGGTVSGIDILFEPANLENDSGIQDGMCMELSAGVCSSAASDSTNSGFLFTIAPTSASGNWLGGRVTSVPVLSNLGLLLLMIIVISFGFYSSKKSIYE